MTKIKTKLLVKQAVCFLLCVALLLVCMGKGGLKAFAATSYNISLDSGLAYSGKVNVTATSLAKENLSLRVGNQTLLPSTEMEAIFNYSTTANTDNIMRAKNVFSLNGSTPVPFSGDGLKGISVNESVLKSGVNTVRITVGNVYGGKTYNPNVGHGIIAQGGNCDDFTLQNFSIKVAGGKELVPYEIKQIKPVAVGKTDFVVEQSEYDLMKEYWLGDGWGNADTYAGHPNARLNIPYAVELDFTYEKPQTLAAFNFDTTAFADGSYTATLFSADSKVSEKQIIIDNNGPIITTGILEGQQIENGYTLSASFTDAGSGIKSSNIMLGSQQIYVPYTFDKPDGKYNIVFSATDNAGNKTYLFRNIIIGKNANPPVQNTSFANGVLTVSKQNQNQNVTVMESQKLDLQFGYGVRSDNTKNQFVESALYGDYQKYNVSNGIDVSASSALGNPFQTFTIDVGLAEAASVVVDFEGGSREGERFAVMAYNVLTDTWQKIGGGEGIKRLSLVLSTVQFAQDGKMKLVVTPEYTDENRDYMYWITDTQYLTKFADLYTYYDKALKYCADEYVSGKMGYLIHTGDIVEDTVDTLGSVEGVDKQWQVAKNAFKYLDDANVPYGIVSGNHDTGTNINTLDYSFYTKYFGEQYYNNNAWYGGGQQDNKNHYDLVTIGGYDFVALYLGYGIEGTEETVTWANDVLKKYAHRNAFINTHSYLTAEGSADSTSRADVILEQIVKPNDNVKFLLCGHINGAARQTVKISDTRDFKIILSDYQFIERESTGSNHIVGTTPGCNGEGYLRTIKVGENSLSMDTFSPVVKKSIYPFGKNADKFTEKINFNMPDRKVTTKNISAAIIGAAIENATEDEATITTNVGDRKHLVVKFNTDGSYAFKLISLSQAGAAPAQQTALSLDYLTFKTTYDFMRAVNKKGFTKDSFAQFKQTVAQYQSIADGSDGLEIKKAIAALNASYEKLLPKKAFPAWATVLIVVGCVAIVGGAAAVVLIFFKKKKGFIIKKDTNDKNTDNKDIDMVDTADTENEDTNTADTNNEDTDNKATNNFSNKENEDK